MIEPIRSLPMPAWQEHPTPAKSDLKATEAEVTSLYYQSSIQSLTTPAPQEQLEKVQEKKKQPLLIQAKDWLWSIFGRGSANAIEASSIATESNPQEVFFAGGTPSLEKPEIEDKKRLSHAISELNHELVTRLKDMAEFEEEMRKSSSNQLDKFIFLELVKCSLNQKNLKETASIIAYDDTLSFYDKNKKLQERHFSLVDAIHSENKARRILKWINVGLTGVAVAGSAVGFAVAGPPGFFAVGIPLSGIGKGTTTLINGVLKYTNDRKTGDLLVVKQETKVNSSHITDRLSDMQSSNEDITALLKMIRQHLNNQAKAERASFGYNA